MADETSDIVTHSTQWEVLRSWLLGNEGRISRCEDGLGMLACVFRTVIGREADET